MLSSSRAPTTGAVPVTRQASAALTRILIVEQDRLVGVALSFMLSARRFDQVRCVRSAARAAAIAEQFQPEIAFLDLELLPDGGFALARQLVRTARFRQPRLIALTKLTGPPAHEAIRAAGFERILAKPVSPCELDDVLGADRMRA